MFVLRKLNKLLPRSLPKCDLHVIRKGTSYIKTVTSQNLNLLKQKILKELTSETKWIFSPGDFPDLKENNFLVLPNYNFFFSSKKYF